MIASRVPRLSRVLELLALVVLGIVAGYVVTNVDIVRLRGFDDALRTFTASPTSTWPLKPFLARMIPTSLAAIALAWFASRRGGEMGFAPLQRAAFVLVPLFASFIVLTQDDVTRRAPFTSLLLAASVGAALWLGTADRESPPESAEPRVRDVRVHAPVLLAMLLHAVIFSFLSIRRDLALWSATVDLGLFKEALWNTLHGRVLYSPTVGYSFLGEHFSPVLLFLVPLYALAPYSATILIVQACAISLAAWPLYKLAIANGLGRGLATALAASMLFAPAMQHSIMYDFHMDLLGVPCLAWVIYAADRRHYRTLAIAAALLCTVKEEAFVSITGVALAMFFADRRRGTRAPILLAALTLLYCGLAIAVFIKRFGPPPGVPEYMSNGQSHGYKFMRNFSHFGGPHGPLDKPMRFIVWAFTDSRLTTIFVLFAPVLLAPFFAGPRIFVLTPLAILLLSDNPDVTEMRYHYGAMQHPGVYAAAVYGMASCLRHARAARRENLRVALVAGVVVATSAMQGLHPLSVLAETNQLDQRHVTARSRAVHRLAALVPARAAVTATSFGGPQFSNRFALQMFPQGTAQSDWAYVDLQRPAWPGSVASRDATLLSMLRHDWGAVAWVDGAIVLHRGGDATRNRDAVRDLFAHRRYEVEGTEDTDFRHAIEADRDASDGYARVVHPTDRRTGRWVVFGPYVDLPRGAYRVTYRLRAGAATFPGDLGEVDVFQNGRVVSHHVLVEDDFPDAAWHDVSLTFDSAGGGGFEFRVRTGKSALLGADRISIDAEGDDAEVLRRWGM
jgi:uncharacterized membrane protein